MIRLFSRLFHREKEAHPFCSAIVAAAGSSRRMGEVNKLMAPLLDGVPVLAWTLRALNEAELVDEIVVAVREEDLLSTGDLCKIYGISKPVKIVRGGTPGWTPCWRPAWSAGRTPPFWRSTTGRGPWRRRRSSTAPSPWPAAPTPPRPPCR